MRHATVGIGFRARAFATLALLGIGTMAAFATLVDWLR